MSVSTPPPHLLEAYRDVEGAVRAVKNRKRRLSLESSLWVGLWYGLALGAVPVALDFGFGVHPPLPGPLGMGLFWGGAAFVLSLLVALVRGLWVRTSDHEAAKLLDDKLGLKDKVSSALAFLENPSPPEELAIAAAAREAKSVRPEEVLPRYLSRPPAIALLVIGAAALGAASAALFRFLEQPEDPLLAVDDTASEKEKDKRQKEIDRLVDEFKKLSEGAKKIGADQETQDFLERAKKDLERLALEQSSLSKSDVLSRLSELEKTARDIAKNLDPKTSNEAISRAAKALEEAFKSQALSDAMAAQDFSKAAEELEKLAKELESKPPMTKEEAEEKARELERAARELERTDPELAKELKKAAEMLEKGDFSELKKALEQVAKTMKRSPETLSRRRASARSIAAALERLEGAKVEISERPAYATGSGSKKTSKTSKGGKKSGKPGTGKKIKKVTVRPGGGGAEGEAQECPPGVADCEEGGDEMTLTLGSGENGGGFTLPIPGGGEGEGEGENGNNNENGPPGGGGRGGGDAPNNHEPGRDPLAIGGSEFIEGNTGPSGPTTVEIVRGMVGDDVALEEYSGVYTAFRRIAEEAMYAEDIPLTRRRYIQAYFELIRPQAGARAKSAPEDSAPPAPREIE